MITREWQRHIDNWMKYLAAAGAPSTTMGLREYHMRTVAAGVGKTPKTVTVDDLTTWLASKQWSPNTRRGYRNSMRAFYSWALARGYVATSPAHQLPPVRVPRGQPRPVPDEVYRHAVRMADERTRLAVRLAGECGLRRAEVARARAEDVEPDLIGWQLRVTGKGGHVRMVPLPDDLAREIMRHDPGWLFPSTHGGHLTPAHLGKTVSALLTKAHAMHGLRHRAGTKAYAGTRDIRAVQEFLGHAKPETTAIYTQIERSAIRAAMEAAA